MVIEEKLFRLIPVNDHSNFFDLELLYDIGGKNPRKEFKNVGYGLTIESALSQIANYMVFKKCNINTITFKQYVEEYKKAVKEIENLLK